MRTEYEITNVYVKTAGRWSMEHTYDIGFTIRFETKTKERYRKVRDFFDTKQDIYKNIFSSFRTVLGHWRYSYVKYNKKNGNINVTIQGVQTKSTSSDIKNGIYEVLTDKKHMLLNSGTGTDWKTGLANFGIKILSQKV